MSTMIDDERIERARNQQQCEPPDDLPPLNDHIPDETPPRFEWEPQEPTEQERAEFFGEFGVRLSRPFSL